MNTVQNSKIEIYSNQTLSQISQTNTHFINSDKIKESYKFNFIPKENKELHLNKNGYFNKQYKVADKINNVMQSIVSNYGISTATYTHDLINTFANAIDSNNSFMVKNRDKESEKFGVDYIRKDTTQSELYKNFEVATFTNNENIDKYNAKYSQDKASVFDRFMLYSELVLNVDEKTMNDKEFQKKVQEDMANLYGLSADFTFDSKLQKDMLKEETKLMALSPKDRIEAHNKTIQNSTKLYISVASSSIASKIKTKQELNEVIEKAQEIIKKEPKAITEQNYINKESRQNQLNFLKQLQLKLKDINVFEPLTIFKQTNNAIISNNKIDGNLYG